jgi:hypothetical protein
VIAYAKFYSRSHDAVIRVYDHAGNVIENARAGGRAASHRRAEDHPIDRQQFTQIPFGRSGAAIKLLEHGQRRF